MRVILVALLLAAAVTSCAPPAPDVAQDRKASEAITQQSQKDLLAGNFDTTLATYADDAVSMPHGGPMIKGKEAIRAEMVRMIGTGMKFSKVIFTTLDVKVNGNSAFEIGTFDMAFAMPGGSEMSEQGKYLTVYERGPDGKWRIKVETWNGDAPTPAPGQ